MVHGNSWETKGQYSVRELTLLEGETVEEQFVPDSGIVPDTPVKGQLLVLTSRRVISFVDVDGHKEMFLAPLEELRGVSLKANAKGFRDLFQGLIVMLIGILSYFILGYVLDGIAVALALGAAIVFVGMLFLSKYLFWEEEGSITFQGSSWEMAFPFKSNMARADVYRLIDRFFQLKLETNSHKSPLGRESELRPPRLPYSPPPGDTSFDI